MIEELLDAMYSNDQLHRLTKLELYDMEDLQDEP